MESWHITLSTHRFIHQLESSAELWCPKFVYGVSLLSMIDYVIDLVVELSLQSSLVGSWSYPKFQPYNQMMSLFGDPIWRPRMCHLNSIPKTPLNQEIPRVFEAFLRTMDKNQIFFIILVSFTWPIVKLICISALCEKDNTLEHAAFLFFLFHFKNLTLGNLHKQVERRCSC